MTTILKALIEQPYWVIALILGVVLIVFPCVTVSENFRWTSHPPTTELPVVVGIVLLLISLGGFAFTLRSADAGSSHAGLNFARVKETGGVLSTSVNGCEIRVVTGRIDEYSSGTDTAIVLPCNEYFDDRCINDVRSALGAYVNRVFSGQTDAFISLVREECGRKLGAGTRQQKTEEECAESYGAGRCVLVTNPLGRSVPVALVSTTTQRAGQGLSSQISYLFGGMHELAKALADARINEVAMPVLGAGHGGIDPPLAFVGLLLAVAEAARYGQGAQRLRRVTIVVFKRDPNTPQQVDPMVIRRVLALIGSQD